MKTNITLFLLLLNIHLTAQEFISYKNLDMDNSLQALAIDESTGRVWVGTNATTTGETFAFLENENWTILNANDLGLIPGRATDILANNGVVEVCSFGGLSRIDYDNQNYQTWTSQNSDMQTDAVLSMAKDIQNDILFVGIGSGFEMQSFDGNNWSILDDVKFSYSSVFDSQNSTLWVGGSSKLFKLREDVITIYDNNNTNIPFGDILDLEVDSKGEVWLVQEDKGLLHFDGESTFAEYNTSNSEIFADNPSKIAIAPDDNIWIGGAQYNALSSFNGANWTHYQTSDSELPSANIRQMKCDNTGALWMASAAGLVKFGFQPSNTKAVALLEYILYPNPASDFITLEGSKKYSKYTIYNSLGSIVKVGTQLDQTIDISILEVGIYWMNIWDEKGVLIGREKILKSN